MALKERGGFAPPLFASTPRLGNQRRLAIREFAECLLNGYVHFTFRAYLSGRPRRLDRKQAKREGTDWQFFL